MKIIVLIKQVPDTSHERSLDMATGRIERSSDGCVVDEISERALEMALRFKDVDKKTEVVAMSVGPRHATAALRKSLSTGADSALHVCDDGLIGADSAWTSQVISAALRDSKFDLVIAGSQSTDGWTGAVPAMVAEYLGLPLLGFVDDVEVSANLVSGHRHGDGTVMKLHTTLPALVTVTERSPEVRFPSFKGILSGKRKSITNLSLADLGMLASDRKGSGQSVVVSTSVKPARSAGKKIVDDGAAANDLAEFLISSKLI